MCSIKRTAKALCLLLVQGSHSGCLQCTGLEPCMADSWPVACRRWISATPRGSCIGMSSPTM